MAEFITPHSAVVAPGKGEGGGSGLRGARGVGLGAFWVIFPLALHGASGARGFHPDAGMKRAGREGGVKR